MRFVTPAVLFATAAGVWVYNQRPDRQVVFPLLDRLSQSPYTQGRLTVGILVALGAVTLAFAVYGAWRERQVD
ncbi:MAG: hypothetical protein R3F61_11535 [Myxococcota bacterium]